MIVTFAEAIVISGMGVLFAVIFGNFIFSDDINNAIFFVLCMILADQLYYDFVKVNDVRQKEDHE